jgi:hypothetical protein
MSLRRHLRGYDKSTEALQAQYAVPDDLLALAGRLLGTIPDDPELLDPHELTPDQVQALAKELGMPIDPHQYDYYFESDESWQKVAEMRDALSRT